jgi:hypothetical protein
MATGSAIEDSIAVRKMMVIGGAIAVRKMIVERGAIPCRDGKVWDEGSAIRRPPMLRKRVSGWEGAIAVLSEGKVARLSLAVNRKFNRLLGEWGGRDGVN